MSQFPTVAAAAAGVRTATANSHTTQGDTLLPTQLSSPLLARGNTSHPPAPQVAARHWAGTAGRDEGGAAAVFLRRLRFKE